MSRIRTYVRAVTCGSRSDLGALKSTTPTDLVLWDGTVGPGSHTWTITSEGSSVNVYGLWVGAGTTPPTVWSVSLSASATSQVAGQPVTFTATTNQSVSGTGYQIELMEQGSPEPLCLVFVGTVLQCSLIFEGPAVGTHTFIAVVASCGLPATAFGACDTSTVVAQSSTVTVTWYVAPPIVPTFSLDITSGGSDHTLFFFGSSSSYSALESDASSSTLSQYPLFPIAEYLVRSVLPVTAGTHLPLYSVQAFPGTDSSPPSSGQLSSSETSRLTEEAFAWAYDYDFGLVLPGYPSATSVFDQLVQNELGQQIGIVAGTLVNDLTIISPIIAHIATLIGTTGSQAVGKFASLFVEIAHGAQSLSGMFPSDPTIDSQVESCFTSVGLPSPGSNVQPGAAVAILAESNASDTTLTSLAKCVYQDAYGSALPTDAQSYAVGLLQNIGTEVYNQAFSVGAGAAAAGAYSFAALYFGAGYSAADAGTAATQAELSQVSGTFDDAFVPLELLAAAGIVSQTFILPRVDQLQEEVNIQQTGAALGTTTSTDLQQIGATNGTTQPIAGDTVGNAEADIGVLWADLAAWGSIDYAYVNSELFPSQSQLSGDSGLAMAAGGNAFYLLRYEVASYQLATSLANAAVATNTSSTSSGTASNGNASITFQGTGTVSLRTFTGTPVTQANLNIGSQYFDLGFLSGSDATSATLTICGVLADQSLWWQTAAGQWQQMTPGGSYNSATSCLAVTFNASSDPTISELTGTVLSVASPATSLSLGGGALSPGVVGQGFFATLSAAGGTTPYLFSVTGGRLPGGVTLNATTGVISGTPTATGTFSFTVQVTDSSASPQSASAAFSLSISPATPGCITSTIHGKFVVPAGSSACVGRGGRITGPVNVESGGTLWVLDGAITGPITSMQAATVGLCGATISGPVRISGTTEEIVIGDGGGCDGNVITGPVSLTKNSGGAELLMGNTITGPVTVDGNTSLISLIGSNSITGPFECSSNSPAPTNGGSMNTVTGPKNGQCASL